MPGAFASERQREQWHRDSERARASSRAHRCALCGGRWHAERGDPRMWSQDYRWHPNCPGTFGTDAERQQWQRYPGPKRSIGWRALRLGYSYYH
jgi:hypothetical protein